MKGKKTSAGFLWEANRAQVYLVDLAPQARTTAVYISYKGLGTVVQRGEFPV